MLNFLRQSASGIIVKTLLAMLILSFAAWGIGDVFRSRASRQVVASVGDSDIGPGAFKTELERELARLKPMLGENFTAEQAKLMGIGDAILRRMINTELYNAGARDLGLGVSDAVVLSEIQRAPEFFDKSGKFNRTVFEQLLFNNGMTEASYIQAVRMNLMRQQFLSPISSGVVFPATLAKKLFAYSGEKRVLEVVRIAHAEQKGIPSPGDAELETYHRENQHLFMSAEYRTLSAVVIRVDDVAATLSIDSGDLEAAYDERLDEFSQAETRQLSQILLPDEAAATLARNAITRGRSFVEAAGDAGINDKTTDIGGFTREQLLPELQDPVFTAQVGDVLEPIKSVLGWHVLQVRAITPQHIRSFAEVRDRLEKTLKAERALDEMFKLSNRLEDLLGGGMTLEEAGRELNLDIVTARLNARGQTADGKPAATAYADELAEVAFGLQAGEESPLGNTRDGQAFRVVRLDAVTPPALKPLSEVRDAVAAGWLANARADSASKATEELLGRVTDGTPLDVAAAAMGYTATASQPFDREGRGLTDALPASVVRDVFDLEVGGALSSPGNGSHVVVQLKSVVAADAADAATLKAFSQSALDELQIDLMDQLSNALRGGHGVTVNQSMLDQAY